MKLSPEHKNMIDECLQKLDRLDWREERFIHKIKYSEFMPQKDIEKLELIWEEII